jgi:hypothetical protein
MAKVQARFFTESDLKCERERLLHEAGVSERDLRQRGAQHRLNAKERVILGDLDDLQWLMT